MATATKTRVLADRVLVRPEEAPGTSKGGIALPENSREKSTRGKVISVGPGKILDNGDLRPVQIKVGERVAYERYAGTQITIDGDELIILREQDVLGVLDPDAD